MQYEQFMNFLVTLASVELEMIFWHERLTNLVIQKICTKITLKFYDFSLIC